MKKIIVCFLLICIIGLCCFTLSSCDDENDLSPNTPNEPSVKCELVKNKFQCWDKTYMESTYHYERNIYTFRIWYSYEYYLADVDIPLIKCSCPYIVSYYGPPETDFRYVGETTIDPIEDFDCYAEYLLGYDSKVVAVKPDSWIYFEIPIAMTDNISESQIITIELLKNLGISQSPKSIAQYTIDLFGTYKTA